MSFFDILGLIDLCVYQPMSPHGLSCPVGLSLSVPSATDGVLNGLCPSCDQLNDECARDELCTLEKPPDSH